MPRHRSRLRPGLAAGLVAGLVGLVTIGLLAFSRPVSVPAAEHGAASLPPAAGSAGSPESARKAEPPGEEGAPATGGSGDSACPIATSKAASLPVLNLPEPLEIQRARFISADCREEAGLFLQAAELYRLGLNGQDGMAPFWRWNLFRALSGGEKHPEALRELKALLESHPGPVLTGRVRDHIAERFVRPEGISPLLQTAYLSAYLNGVDPTHRDADLLERQWNLARAIGDTALQSSTALQLWRNPADAAAAKRWPPLIITGPGAKDTGKNAGKGGTAAGRFVPSPKDILARSSRLFRLRQYKLLAAEVENTLLKGPLPPLTKTGAGDGAGKWAGKGGGPAFFPPKDAKALGRLYFRSLIRARLLRHAAVQVNTPSLIKRFSFTKRQRLIWAIRIQLKRRKIGPALKYLGELEKVSPKDAALPTIFLELLRYNRGRKDWVTMMHWFQRIVSEFPDLQKTSDAYWQIIWDATTGKRYPDSLKWIGVALANGGAFDAADHGRLLYWKGRILLRMGKKKEGMAVWNDLREQWPYGYYAAMAGWRESGAPLALDRSPDGSAPPQPSQPIIAALWELAPFPNAIFLFSVGDDGLASKRLGKALSRPMSGEALEEAAALFFYLGRMYLLQRLIANHHLDTLRRSPIADTPLWRRSHPLPYWDLVGRMSSEYQVDPFFAMAIMREESRFLTRADSTAGAKGLMQLLPGTASSIARRNKLPYEENLLHLPEMNIPLGMIYLKRVIKRFQGNLFYAAAAYNAGPGNVSRWKKRFGKVTDDVFVERIPYGETQRYVKRVFLAYWVYTRLYPPPVREAPSKSP